jgi:hypothetical protein
LGGEKDDLARVMRAVCDVHRVGLRLVHCDPRWRYTGASDRYLLATGRRLSTYLAQGTEICAYVFFVYILRFTHCKSVKRQAQ